MKYYLVLKCNRCGEVIINEVSDYDTIVRVKDYNDYLHICNEGNGIVKQGFCTVIGFDITQGE